MAREKLATRSARAWRLAGEQHGIVTRQQLRALGFSAEAIDHRIEQGRLHIVGRGVYAVGLPALTRERRWMAAVLACGGDAALSHHSAASLWEFGEEKGDIVDVSVLRRSRRRRPGIRVRGRAKLPATDVTRRQGIPVTRPARTLLDLATELDGRSLERAVNEADRLGLIGADRLRETLDAFAGEPGVRPLRDLLDPHTFRLSDSELERLFRPIAASAGLPPPLTQAPVNGFEVDFFWPELGLVVETDGLRYHRTPSSQARDRLRDQAHTAAGLTPLRFTHHQVSYEPQRVRSVLERTARRLRPLRCEP